jgi:hypothetical protein
MRALALALLLGASAAAAQAPATTPAPAAPQVKGGGGGEFRVGGFMISGDRSFEFRDSVSTATGTIQGLDIVLRSKPIGIQIKSLTGTFEGQPHVTSADARILIFPPVFTVMVGAGRRALWSDLNASSPTQFDLIQFGLSSTIVIGGSGLRTNFAAAMYQATGDNKDKVKGGMEGEASILYRLPKVPLFLQVGYRTEVFTQQTTTSGVGGGTRLTPEEVRGVKIGGGMVLGGR